MARYAARVDANQKRVTLELRKKPGVSVAVTSSLGNGFGDLVVGYRGVNYLIELKDGDKPPSERKLTEAEEKFHKGWTGQICVALGVEDILEVIGWRGR